MAADHALDRRSRYSAAPSTITADPVNTELVGSVHASTAHPVSPIAGITRRDGCNVQALALAMA